MKQKLISLPLIISLYSFMFSFSILNLFSSDNPSSGEFPKDPSTEIDLKNIKEIPDLFFECFIAEMNESFKIPLFYDPLVREYIEIYLVERSSQIALLAERSEVYFPIFEKFLSDFQLPLELKYIPVIESGLNTHALSPSGALGLWQFKPETGHAYGLFNTNGVDERINPEKSTNAACKYLSYLYKTFDNWQLCLMAYHAGPTTIKNAILKAGGNSSYKAIYPFLPVATQRYLPAYIASIYVLNFYKKHF